MLPDTTRMGASEVEATRDKPTKASTVRRVDMIRLMSQSDHGEKISVLKTEEEVLGRGRKALAVLIVVLALGFESEPALAQQAAPGDSGHASPSEHGDHSAADPVQSGNDAAVAGDGNGTVNEAPVAASADSMPPQTELKTITLGAEDPGAVPLAVPDKAKETPLEEVIVTAQRRTQDLQKTPVAVTALSEKTLTERNIQSTQDLMQVAPSLQVSTETAGPGGGSAVFFLRGMGQQRSGNGTEPAVGVYVDGVYYPSPQGAIFSILDLQQVEVLRGPQGTLFGRNTIGGAIRYTSKAPEFDDNGYVQGTAGSYDRRDLVGAVNLAYQDLVAMRLSGGRLQRDGYVRQQDGGKDAGAQDDKVARAQIRFAPMQTLEVNLEGQYSRTLLDGLTYNQPGPIKPTPNTVPWYYNLTATGGLLYPPYDDRFASTCDYCQAGTNIREFAKSDGDGANMSVIWTGLDSVEVKSLTAWQRVDSNFALDLDGSPAPVYSAAAHLQDEIYSQEFQFSGKAFDEKLDWVGGLYGAQQTSDVLPGGTQLLFGVIPNDPAPLSRKTDTGAAFIDMTYELFDNAHVLGGYRISQDNKKATLYDKNSGDETEQERKKFTSNTGRVGLQYQWTSEIMSYATVSTGFRAGGFNLDVNTPLIFTPALYQYTLAPYKPENVTSYEIGARSEFFGGLVRVNPTIFYAKWKDIQVQSVNVNASALEIFVDNAASAHSEGLELEMQAVASRHLMFFGNLALLKMKYDAIGNATGITTDSRFMRAPKVTYTLGGRYQNDIEGWFQYVLSANWNWQDDQASSATDDDSLSLPSYGLLSMRLDLKSPNDVLEFSVFMTNVTDQTYYVGGANYASSTGTARYDLGRPRETGVSLRYNF
ncbi:TonB-dependent receptor [Solimonas terrae]|uniref:TonB-dependent receptor n=1 Tax=Solimonas terrae TaxID=1396819 RepID=A0A6M2BMJ1_9GAMM|nr:TonB-dependent receptor [Solimonas terrae]NGY03317.1 TonB-dependent receptor [Solimonas terrae]